MTFVVGATADELRRFLAAPPDDEHAVAIAWVFDADGGRVLLVHHPFHGWSCPGGHLEPTEAPADAARRELREETGLDLVPVEAGPVVAVRSVGCPRQPEVPIVHWALGFRFVADPAASLTPEADRPARWFDVGDLPDPRPSDIDDVLAVDSVRGRPIVVRRDGVDAQRGEAAGAGP